MAESGNKKKTPKKKVTAKKVSETPELVEDLLEEDPDLLIEKYIVKNAGADEEIVEEIVEEVPAAPEVVEEVPVAPKKKAIVYDGFDEDDLIEAELELEDEKLLAEYGEPEVEVPVVEEVVEEVPVVEEVVEEAVEEPVLAAPAVEAAEEAAAEAEAVPVKGARKLDKGLLASILAILALAAIIGIIFANSAKQGGLEEVTHETATVAFTTEAPTTAATTATTTAAPSTTVVTVQTPSAAEPEYRPDANGVLTAYRGSVEATDVTGLVYYDGVWYYLDKGKYVSDYFGIVGNEAGRWYVENGKVDFTVSGPRTINGQTVNFEYGKVVE